MSLLLCRQEKVVHPYYFENLGLSLFSSQELAYIIFNHPLLVMDNFIDDNLTEFIRVELDMEFLAAKIDKWRAGGEHPDDMLLMILHECFYYSLPDLNQFRQKISSYRRLPKPVYEKMKADYLFENGQYGRAASCYEKILDFPKERKTDEAFVAKVWNNLGASCARMFLFEKAFSSYRRAWELSENQEALQKMYFIGKLHALSEKERHDLENLDKDKTEAWDRDFEEAQRKAGEDQSLGELDKLFLKDPVKRMAGAAALVRRWKQEYRNML